MEIAMFLVVGKEVGRHGNEGLCLNAPVWGGGEFTNYLHSQVFPFLDVCVGSIIHTVKSMTEYAKSGCSGIYD